MSSTSRRRLHVVWHVLQPTTCVAHSGPTTNTQTNNAALGSCAAHGHSAPRKICHCLCEFRKYDASYSVFQNKLLQRSFSWSKMRCIPDNALVVWEKDNRKMLPKYFTFKSINLSNSVTSNTWLFQGPFKPECCREKLRSSFITQPSGAGTCSCFIWGREVSHSWEWGLWHSFSLFLGKEGHVFSIMVFSSLSV